MPEFEDPWVAPALADGRLGYLELIGRSGRPRRVHLGFARRVDGALVVGAAHRSSRWQYDLLARPRCHFQILGADAAYEAVELAGTDRAEGEAALVERYAANAPRHRLFLLRPVPP